MIQDTESKKEKHRKAVLSLLSGGNDSDIPALSFRREKGVCGCRRSGVSDRSRRKAAEPGAEMKNLCGFFLHDRNKIKSQTSAAFAI